MNNQPLTLQEARALCKKSQRLVGRPLNPQMHAHGRIEHVVVAPICDRAGQKQFVESLVNGARIVAEAYDASVDFTVLVVGRPLRWVRESILFLDLRAYWRMMEAQSRSRRAQRVLAAI
jgi:hypothetical protein